MAQPQDMVDRVMDAANTIANAIKEVNAPIDEYNALGGGNQALQAWFDGFTESKYRGVTQAQFVDGVAALMALATAFNTNKTNISRIRGR